MSSDFEFIETELKRLKNSDRTSERWEFVKIMKGLLGILLDWYKLKEREEVASLIGKYKGIIDDYQVYLHLPKKEKEIENMPDYSQQDLV